MPARKSVAKGQALKCSVCGLVVVVDEVCGCAEAHEIICCQEPMKKRARAAAKKTKAKPKAKAKARK